MNEMESNQIIATQQLILDCIRHLLSKQPPDDLKYLTARLQMNGDAVLNQGSMSIDQVQIYRENLVMLINDVLQRCR